MKCYMIRCHTFGFVILILLGSVVSGAEWLGFTGDFDAAVNWTGFTVPNVSNGAIMNGAESLIDDVSLTSDITVPKAYLSESITLRVNSGGLRQVDPNDRLQLVDSDVVVGPNGSVEATNLFMYGDATFTTLSGLDADFLYMERDATFSGLGVVELRDGLSSTGTISPSFGTLEIRSDETLDFHDGFIDVDGGGGFFADRVELVVDAPVERFRGRLEIGKSDRAVFNQGLEFGIREDTADIEFRGSLEQPASLDVVGRLDFGSSEVHVTSGIANVTSSQSMSLYDSFIRMQPQTQLHLNGDVEVLMCAELGHNAFIQSNADAHVWNFAGCNIDGGHFYNAAGTLSFQPRVTMNTRLLNGAKLDVATGLGVSQLDLEGTSVIEFKITPDYFDQITVAQGAALGGTLKVDLADGWTPDIGSEYPVIVADTTLGQFANLDLPDLGILKWWEVDYGMNGLVLLRVDGIEINLGDFDSTNSWTIADLDILSDAIIQRSTDLAFDLNGDGRVSLADQAAWRQIAAQNNERAESYPIGDVNLDGSVDSTDLGMLLNAFDQSGAYSQGNLNADTTIDSTDLGLLLNSFDRNAGPIGQIGAVVPEPSVGWMWLMIAVHVLFVRQTRASI